MASFLWAANIVLLTILLVAKSFAAGAAVSDATDAIIPLINSVSERALIETSFTTIAGTGSKGYNGDSIPANTAKLNFPTDIVFDALGNLHFIDYSNYRIRKVDKDTGVISTVVGTGQIVFNGDGILAVNAALNPQGFTFDIFGDLFISDAENQRIRKVASATGIITTVAGVGSLGYNGDKILATTALISNPRAIASDAQGNLYFTSDSDNRVRKVTRSTGLITTVVGNGVQGNSTDISTNILATSINISPYRLVFDTSGDFYTIFTYSAQMLKISSSTGMILKSRNISPNMGVAFLDAAGTFYYTDMVSKRIYKELGSGETVLIATGVYCFGIYVDSTGSIYVSASEQHSIFKIDLNGNVATFPTSQPTPTMNVTTPSYLEYGFGYVAVAGYSSTLGGYNGDGQLAIKTRLNLPFDIAFDGEGNLHIADAGNTRVRRVDKYTGIVTTVAGPGEYKASGEFGDGASALSATFFTVSKIAFDTFGDLYILDYCRVRKVTKATGIISAVAGNNDNDFTYHTGGKPAIASSIGIPTHIACDPAGNLFILDVKNGVVWKVDRSTGILTVAFGNRETGVFVMGGYYNLSPTAMALDAAGDLYLSDKSLRTVMKVTLSSGTITLFAPRFEKGESMFVDASGNIYYMEISVGQVRKITLSTGKTTIVARNQYFTGSICADSSGKIYVAGYENHAVFLVPLDTTGEIVPAVTPTPPTRSPFMITPSPTARPTGSPSPPTDQREPARGPMGKPSLRPHRRRPSKAPACKPPRGRSGSY